ncbi:MAG: ATP-binding protein [Verrucomicrobia bacterium]|nr:ATP-binding protein [Verrucomicrobiota bacterium]
MAKKLSLALFLLTNAGTQISYSNLKDILGLGSLNTVKNYIHYLENAYLIFTLNQFSFSVGKQTSAAKKVYAIDTGLIKHVAFQFSHEEELKVEKGFILTLDEKEQIGSIEVIPLYEWLLIS